MKSVNHVNPLFNKIASLFKDYVYKIKISTLNNDIFCY